MDTFDGLPTHPMFVHIPIVLGPLLAGIMVWMAIRPSTRLGRGALLALANLLLVGFLILLVEPSGEFLERELRIETAIAEHQELGQQTVLLSVVMFVASLAMVSFGRLRLRGQQRAMEGSSAPAVAVWGDIAVRSIGAVVAVLLVVWMVRTGHSGASVVWQGVVRE